ncbi:MAG: hypothetical protein H7123_03030 [Thermoleophilia bacterium]|nr:hypothetical protein [Thermoleophilia bacterium]
MTDLTLTRPSLSRPAHRWKDVAAWLPLAMLAAVIALHLAGVSFVRTAQALNSAQVIVTGVVDKDVQFDASACLPGSLAIGTLVPDDPWVDTTSNCMFSFGTNNSSAGADLVVQEDPLAGGGNAMKCVAGCGADSLSDLAGGVAASPGAPNSAFGMRLMSVGGAATNVWNVTPWVYPLSAAATACQTSSAASGTCSFRWGAMSSSGSDQPGSYQAQVQVTVLAR